MSDSAEQFSIEERLGRKWTPFVVIAAILGLVLIVIVGYRLAGNSAVQDLEAQIKQRGQPLTLAELDASYRVPPGASNGAELLLQAWEPAAPDFWRAFRDGRQQLPQRPASTYDVALPFFGPESRRLSRTNELPATNRMATEVYLEGMADHLEAVRAALRCANFRFPVRITNGFNALLPHLAALRTEAMNFRIEALLAYEHGDIDPALAALEDTARVGNTLDNEPCTISQLVRVSCYGFVLEDLQRLMTRRALSAAQLERVDALLDQMAMAGVLRATLISERASDLSAFSLPARQIFGSPGEGTVNEVGFSAGMGAFSFLGLKAADRRLMLETMSDAIALAEKDDPASLERLEELFQKAGEKARQFPPKIYSAILMPGLGRVPLRFASLEARRRAAKTALAVERFRLAHNGSLPENLEALVPEFLKAVPNDPFDGNPLRYTRLPAGFVVYSIGANRIDDGGKERERFSSQDYDETFFIER